jgi:hypothetical protein
MIPSQDYDADRVHYQDAPLVSLRVWSAITGFVSTVLMAEPVQQEILALLPAFVAPEFAPLALAVASFSLAALSKYKDRRPVRNVQTEE